MTSPTLDLRVSEPSSPRFLPLLLILFVGSGCAALIYEIVWLQQLQEIIGASAISLGVLLGTFMGGMCLGSLVLPWIISPRWHPLKVYALLEIGIGLVGIGVLYGLNPITAMYTDSAGHGANSIGLRAVVAAVFLIPPTLLMGATLPAISRWVKTTPKGVEWMGFFYGGNIGGAVFGCLLAGFWLLRLYDMPTATYVAVAINFSVAAIALLLATRSPYTAVSSDEIVIEPIEKQSGTGMIYIIIALSGLSALGAEVVWTRLLSLMFGATVYTFSLILAIFLVGLGIGSSIGAMVARSSDHPRRSLAACQLLLCGAIAWTALNISRSLPYWPINLDYSMSPWYTFQLDLARAAWAILPGAIFWGASFPLALAAVATRGRDAGRMVGGVYAANTLGAIVGSIGFSLFVIPAITTVGAQRVLIGICAFSALLAFMPCLFGSDGEESEGELESPSGMAGRLATAGVAVLIIAALIITIAPMPWISVAFGRQQSLWFKSADPEMYPATAEIGASPSKLERYCVYVGEGMNVSVAVTRDSNGWQYFHGAGKVQASSNPQDMRLQRMLGHLSVLAHPNPNDVKDVLVVACGAGVTAGSFVPYPNVKNVTIVDIEKLVPTVVTPKFSSVNYGIVDGIAEQNPKKMPDGKQVRVIFDDGRHFVRTTREKFDIITSDPIDPWVKGCAALNTIEYYTMCKEHLNPGGVMSLWIPLYESNVETTKSLISTFFQVFPNGIMFSNDDRGEGYDAVLFGINQDGPAQINLDELAALLARPEYQTVKTSLTDVGFGSNKFGGGNSNGEEGVIVDLLATYAGQAADLTKWRADAQINTDRNLRLQYLAGMALNTYVPTDILRSMTDYYRFPTEVFHGNSQRLDALRQALSSTGRHEKVAPTSAP
ncbi:MAG TPA: hypothetical protein VHD56_11835 [Tepidisphaeraceae bacterium]|nr:hypothetical protein [Tepidisphaeraceae bacterium]